MTKKDLKKPRGCRAITAWCYLLQLYFKVNYQQSYIVERERNGVFPRSKP